MSPQAARRSRFERSRERGLTGPGGGRGGEVSTKAGEAALKLGPSCYLETAREGNSVWLTLIGELDMSCSERFVTCLKEGVADDPEHLVVDLRSLTFIDSTGVALLLKAHSLAGQRGFELHVVPSPTVIVAAVFEAAGLAKVLPISDAPPAFPT